MLGRFGGVQVGIKIFGKYCSYANWPSAVPEKIALGDPAVDHEKEKNEYSDRHETGGGITVFFHRFSYSISTGMKYIHWVQGLFEIFIILYEGLPSDMEKNRAYLVLMHSYWLEMG